MYFMLSLSALYWYQFFIFALTTILMSNCGTSLGIFFASVFPELTIALSVTPMVILPLMIFGGLFVNQGAIPVYFDWIK